MSRVSSTAPHLSAEAIKQKIKSADSYWHRQKWLVVYNGLVDPRPVAEIAQHTGVSVGSVHKVISQYNRLGADALALPGKGGRRNQYLTLEQEKAFVASFREKATKGQIARVAEIKLAYEKLVGRTVHKTTIYRLLDRHEWRKIVPRPRHIKADAEEQQAFKKTFAPQLNKS